MIRTVCAAGHPKEVVARLNAALVQRLGDSAVQARLRDLGLDRGPAERQTPEGLAGFQRAEIERWWPILKSASFKAE